MDQNKINKIAVVALIFALIGIANAGTIANILSDLTCVNCTLDNPTFVNYTIPNGSGTSNHSELNQLNWSESGHIMNGDIVPTQEQFKVVTNESNNTVSGLYLNQKLEGDWEDTAGIKLWSYDSTNGATSNIISKSDEIFFQITDDYSPVTTVILHPDTIDMTTTNLIMNGQTGITADVPYMETAIVPKTMHFENGILTSIT